MQTPLALLKCPVQTPGLLWTAHSSQDMGTKAIRTKNKWKGIDRPKLVPSGLLPLALLCKEFEVEERQRPLGALGHRSTLRAELMVCFLGFKQFTKLDDFSMDSLFGTIVYAEFTQL